MPPQIERAGSYPKGRRRRAEIVGAALRAFGETGYRNASMARIAADCGVSRAGMAHHFPSKEALLAAVLAERDRVNAEQFSVGDGVDPDGTDALSRMARVIAHNATQPGIVGLFAMLSTEASDPAHPAHDYFVARYRRLRGEMREALRRASAAGLVRPGVDLDGVEVELIALVDGLQVQWLLDADEVDMAARFRRRLGEILRVPPPEG